MASNEVFGTGNGTATAFQLTMTYDPQYILIGTEGSFFYVRAITLLATTPVIKSDNVIVPGSGYTISKSGLVTFGTAPAVGKQLTWSGEFDVPCRFDTDSLPVVLTSPIWPACARCRSRK